MGLAANPLASPLPTAPPSARHVNRRLLAARDNEVDTCGFIDGAFGNHPPVAYLVTLPG